MAADEIQCALDKWGNLQEVGTDQDAYGVFYLQKGILSMNVFHEPVEYLYVTVDRNVNFFEIFLVC